MVQDAHVVNNINLWQSLHISVFLEVTDRHNGRMTEQIRADNCFHYVFDPGVDRIDLGRALRQRDGMNPLEAANLQHGFVCKVEHRIKFENSGIRDLLRCITLASPCGIPETSSLVIGGKTHPRQHLVQANQIVIAQVFNLPGFNIVQVKSFLRQFRPSPDPLIFIIGSGLTAGTSLSGLLRRK